jgi:hypothetical protein
MDQTTLAEPLGEHHLGGTDQPWSPVGDDQQRRCEAATVEVGEEAGPGVVALRCSWGQADEGRRTFGGDLLDAQRRFGQCTGMELEVRAVEVQAVVDDPRKSRVRQASKSILMASQI